MVRYNCSVELSVNVKSSSPQSGSYSRENLIAESKPRKQTPNTSELFSCLVWTTDCTHYSEAINTNQPFFQQVPFATACVDVRCWVPSREKGSKLRTLRRRSHSTCRGGGGGGVAHTRATGDQDRWALTFRGLRDASPPATSPCWHERTVTLLFP